MKEQKTTGQSGKPITFLVPESAEDIAYLRKMDEEGTLGSFSNFSEYKVDPEWRKKSGLPSWSEKIEIVKENLIKVLSNIAIDGRSLPIDSSESIRKMVVGFIYRLNEVNSGNPTHDIIVEVSTESLNKLQEESRINEQAKPFIYHAVYSLRWLADPGK